MGKYRFLPLLLLVLFSCQKEENPDPTTELLQGTWIPISTTTEFYNAANVKVHEELTSILKGTLTITHKNLFFNYTDIPPFAATYEIGEKDGKKYLDVTPPDGGTSQPFEISNLTDSNLTWLVDIPNYMYYENGVEKKQLNAWLD